MTSAGEVLAWLRALPGLESCFYQPHQEVGFLLDAPPETVSGIEEELFEGAGPPLENLITDLYFLVPSKLWPETTLRMRSYAAGAHAGTVTLIATGRARAYERVFVAILRQDRPYPELVAHVHEIIAETVSPTVLLEVRKRRRAVFPAPFAFRCGGALATDYCNLAVDRQIAVRRARNGEMFALQHPFGLESPSIVEVEWAGLGRPAGAAALAKVNHSINRHRCRHRPKLRRKALDLVDAP